MIRHPYTIPFIWIRLCARNMPCVHRSRKRLFCQRRLKSRIHFPWAHTTTISCRYRYGMRRINSGRDLWKAIVRVDMERLVLRRKERRRFRPSTVLIIIWRSNGTLMSTTCLSIYQMPKTWMWWKNASKSIQGTSCLWKRDTNRRGPRCKES